MVGVEGVEEAFAGLERYPVAVPGTHNARRAGLDVLNVAHVERPACMVALAVQGMHLSVCLEEGNGASANGHQLQETEKG